MAPDFNPPHGPRSASSRNDPNAPCTERGRYGQLHRGHTNGECWMQHPELRRRSSSYRPSYGSYQPLPRDHYNRPSHPNMRKDRPSHHRDLARPESDRRLTTAQEVRHAQPSPACTNNKRRCTPSPTGKEMKRAKPGAPDSDLKPRKDTLNVVAPSAPPETTHPLRPQNGFYHPKRRQAEDLIKEARAALLEAFARHKDIFAHHANVDEVVQEIIDKSDPALKYPPSIIAALLGEASAGKSSLCGELLQDSRAVIKSDTSRGTNHPIKYDKALPDQKFPYLATFEYSTEEQWQSLVREMLDTAMTFYSHMVASPSTSEEKDEAAAAEQEAGHRFQEPDVQRSVSALYSLLCEPEHPHFNNLDSTEAWLKAKAGTPVEEVLEEVMPRIKQLLTQKAASYTPAKTSIEMQQRIKESSFIPNPLKSSHPSKLLRAIGVHSTKFDLPMNALIIADTPGVSDADENVRKLTEEFLRQSDLLLIVLKPFRPEDRLESLLPYFQQAINADKEVVLVFTHADTADRIAPEDVEHEEGLSDDDKKRLLAIDEKLSQARKGTAVLSDAQRSSLRSQRIVIERDIRNEKVRRVVLPWATKILGTRNPPQCFFVSTLEAREHREPIDDQAPRVSMQDTGLPALANALYQRVGQPKLEVLQDLLADLPFFLRKLIRLVSKTPRTRQAELRGKVSNALGAAGKRVAPAYTQILNLHHHVVAAVDRDIDLWRKKAERRVIAWRDDDTSKHSAVFRATCRRYGNYQPPTPTGPTTRNASRNAATANKPWTPQIQEIMTPGIESATLKTLKDLTQHREELKLTSLQVSETLRRSIGEMEGLEDDTGSSNKQRFLAKLEERLVRLQSKNGRRFDKVEEQIRSVERFLIRNTTTDSFVARTLRPAYEAAGKLEAQKPPDPARPRRGEAARARKAHHERASILMRTLHDQVPANGQEAEAGLQGFLPALKKVIKEEFEGKLGVQVLYMQREWDRFVTMVMGDFNHYFSVKEDGVEDFDREAGANLAENAEYAIKKLKEAGRCLDRTGQ